MAAILVLTEIVLTRILLFYCLIFSYTSEIKNAWILLDYFVEKKYRRKDNLHLFVNFLGFSRKPIYLSQNLRFLNLQAR